jgi:very-short-patch-repair endonuclease
MIAKVTFARRLRRDQTDAERVIWFRLRDRRLNGLKFKRQVPIDKYVVDFLCTEARLIIELDGGQHAARDETTRTAVLEAMGYLVLRFWNNDVLQNTEGVLEEILNAVNRQAQEPPHHSRRFASAFFDTKNGGRRPPTPLPSGERERCGSTDV